MKYLFWIMTLSKNGRIPIKAEEVSQNVPKVHSTIRFVSIKPPIYEFLVVFPARIWTMYGVFNDVSTFCPIRYTWYSVVHDKKHRLYQ